MKELIMAKCTIQVKGNLARDAEAKVSKLARCIAFCQSGLHRAKKNAAGEWENGETMWFNVTVFAELNPLEFTKGSPVELEGTFTHRTYTKKDGTIGYALDVVTDLVKIIPRGNSVSGNSAQAQDDWKQKDNWQNPAPLILEDLPF
jgi:single-stranded DNA-binding protein